MTGYVCGDPLCSQSGFASVQNIYTAIKLNLMESSLAQSTCSVVPRKGFLLDCVYSERSCCKAYRRSTRGQGGDFDKRGTHLGVFIILDKGDGRHDT